MSARDRQRFAVAFFTIIGFAAAILLFGVVATSPAYAQTPSADPSCDPAQEPATADWDYSYEPCSPSWARDTTQVQAVYDAANDSVGSSVRIILTLGFAVVAIPLYALVFLQIGRT